MASAAQQHNLHLLWRAGFGPSALQIPGLRHISAKKLYHSLHTSSEKKTEDLDVIDKDLVALAANAAAGMRIRKMLPADEKKMLRIKNRDSIKRLNLTWLDRMVTTEAQLREKAAFFWHGHFACRNVNAVYQQALLNIIRRYALGSFRDLLHEVSKSGAMMNFLNNNQNRKGHPNENFAREVMELFTLGRGNYTETDVKEAARAFTGWGADPAGEFVFRRQQHDTGEKTVLGKTGNFDGDDVLDILLDQKQTARFIVQKIYRFFVNEQLDNDNITVLADHFYSSGYDIAALLKEIFTASWFYDRVNTGTRIKSPVELIVGIRRMLPMRIENDNTLLTLQRILGQVLLYPPNVAGWPGGKSWIDSSTLMMRMRLPGLLSDADILNVRPKDDDDQMMGRKDDEATVRLRAKERKIFNADIEWNNYTNIFADIPKEKLIDALAGVLLQTDTTVPEDLVRKHADVSSRDNFIRSATIRMMSLPEYQMC